MELNETHRELIRKRLEGIEGGIKRVAKLADITEQTAHKLLNGGNCKGEVIEAFVAGLEKAEEIRDLFNKNLTSRLTKTAAA